MDCRFLQIYIHKKGFQRESFDVSAGLHFLCKHWERFMLNQNGEGEGEVAIFSAKRWDRRNRAGLIESATPCHDAQVVGSYRGLNPFHLTVLTSKSEDYTTAPQHLQWSPGARHFCLWEPGAQ